MKRLFSALGLFVLAVFAGNRAAAAPFPFTVELELAGSPSAILGLMRAHGVSADALREALAWDYLFIVAYSLFIANAASAVGRRLGEKWDDAGAAVAFATLLAGALDALENTLLLHALEGRFGAAGAAVAAALKVVLLIGAVAYTVVGLAVLSRQALGRRPEAPLPRPEPLAADAPARSRECNVVMKGGITSGIVYPRAVARLAKEYDFVNVGGSSAGAIAAAATAAAAYARKNGRDAFAVLEKLPAYLGEKGRLFGLFRPNPSVRAPFEVFSTFLGKAPVPFKLARSLAVSGWHFPFAVALGLAPGVLFAVGAFSTPAPAWGVTAAVALGLVGAPLFAVAAFVIALVLRLPKNGYGMCSGRLDGETVLSDWLGELIDRLAGVEGRPLIFADLWTAGESYATLDERREAARGRPVGKRKVNFEALTTSLVHGRPYRLPETERTFYFRPEDLRRVLPDAAVTWMEQHPGSSDDEVPPGFLALPAPQDLPVVFAARLSLSFPLLISAVRLWGIDRRNARNRGGRGVRQLDACWMSDGGIASNFPIHFFDAWVPGRPTFGLDLAPFHADDDRDPDEAKNVFLPTNNRAGFLESWQRFDGLFGFLGALVNAAQAFLDNMQARAPGFRNRIARIHLAKEEGGMNLAMPSDVLARLGKRGEVAGEKIVERFVGESPSGWENHRWVRLRLLLGQLDPLLRQLAREVRRVPPPADPPSYDWNNATQRHLAGAVMDRLTALGDEIEASAATLEDGAPRPRTELKGAPRV